MKKFCSQGRQNFWTPVVGGEVEASDKEHPHRRWRPAGWMGGLFGGWRLTMFSSKKFVKIG